MNKLLLASTISLISVAAFAETVQVQQVPSGQVYTDNQTAPSVYQKQTVVRYNVPTCKNCQTTTTVSRSVNAPEPVVATSPCATGGCRTCSSCAAAATNRQSCVFNNHRYAIANPLFVLKKGQFSSDTNAGYTVRPKKYFFTTPTQIVVDSRYNGWQVAEQIMYGITDWLSLKVEGGYSANRAKKSTWNLTPDTRGTSPRRNYDYNGKIGLQAHAVDFCNFDLIVGVDAKWGKAGFKEGSCKDSADYKFVTPYAIMGTQITKYVTPYVQAGYNFAVDTKGADDNYVVQPGFYIQPSKYWALHPYVILEEHRKPEWRMGLDFYPYQNVVVGVEGSAIALDNDPMDSYGIFGRVKMTF